MDTEVDIHAPGVTMVKSLCYFCHANCGVLAYVKDGDVIKIEGDPNYTNQGGLCCRGTSALLHVNHPGRINHALKRVGEKGEGKWEQIDYDQAIKEVAERLNQIKAESGAEAIASAGGTTRTDDWARRRFLNIFGTPNGFHNALLCWIPTFMAETCVCGWSPFETDLGTARCLILWGMNPGASTLPGMHGYTDLQMGGMKIIYVDPRYSETAAKADLWLPLRPGTDAALALAMLNVIIRERLYNKEFVNTWCDGFADLKAHIKQYSPAWASKITWLSADQIRTAARMYATNTPGCIQWGCTWDQIGRASTTGSHAIALLRAVTGNLDVPGADGIPGPAINFLTDEEMEANEWLPEEQKAKQIGSNKFKLTSWPGYQLISDNARRKWGKTLPVEWFCEAHGPSVFKAIITGDPYQVRGLIVNATNPINSYGDAKMTLEALKKVEFLVVVEYWMTPTALFADYIFPAAGALERPIIVTHYGATDSLMGGSRAIQPKYDRHTDMVFWRKLGLACGQDPALWPWETEEEANFEIIKPLGLPVNSWDEFVSQVRQYYPPLHQSKFISNGGFWTPSGKVELNSTILRQLGYPGMPTYIGCIENEIDTPEIAEEYPIVLTTGGGFMPFHHSEHFNMPYTRYLYPDPYFDINPELAEKLGIKQGDWCWIETRRGRIKMRAEVQPSVDPRVVFCPRGWWFPERDGSADLDNPFGCLESNVNTLTSVDDEHCDPMGGSWANRGLMCKVYKCGELDKEFTKKDSQWSIPGSSSVPGVTVMPSDQPLAREPIPFEVPQPDFEVPEGYDWCWQDNQLYQKGTFFRYDASGWLVNPRNKSYYDAYTGWRYDADSQCLVDDATGKIYDMNRQEIVYFGNVQCFPGQPAPYELPGLVEWDMERGAGFLPGTDLVYDPNSGWVIDVNAGVYYDAYSGYAYDPTDNTLVDMQTGKRYDMNTRQEIV
ncbi:MAG: dehydrogenase [Eggerthellaceae bacterium]|nr:dehydrogenase [Eggerthellaceae bacterium]